jgi:hypothetical protein
MPAVKTVTPLCGIERSSSTSKPRVAFRTDGFGNRPGFARLNMVHLEVGELVGV